MKIAYLDLGINSSEPYLNPNRYGGANCFPNAALELLNTDTSEFNIFASYQGFENPDFTLMYFKEKCKVITEDQKEAIRQGKPIKDVIPEIERFDIICSHFHNYWINTEGIKAKTATWLVGLNEQVNPKIENILLYSRKYQSPIITNPNAKIYDIKIGRQNEKFQVQKKGDLVFQCSRHCESFKSIEVARWAKKNKIKFIMAGPIDAGYKIMDEVDNKYVYHLGQISQSEKNEFYKVARLTTLISSWPNPFNLSAVESLQNQCPVACNMDIGFWPTLIGDFINGFHVNLNKLEEDLFRAYNLAPFISQLVCWQTGDLYNDIRMVRSFTDCFNKILENK